MGRILGLRHWLEVSTGWPNPVRVCLSSSSESRLYLDVKLAPMNKHAPKGPQPRFKHEQTLYMAAPPL